MSLPRGWIVIKSAYQDAPHPWLGLDADNRLCAQEDSREKATIFTVEPLDQKNGVFALRVVESANKYGFWLSRVPESSGVDYLAAATKLHIDDECKFTFHELPSGTLFAVSARLPNATSERYWHRQRPESSPYSGLIKLEAADYNSDKLCLFMSEPAQL